MRCALALLLAASLAACQARGLNQAESYPAERGAIRLAVNAPAGAYDFVEYVLEPADAPSVVLAKAEAGADGKFGATCDTRTLSNGRHTLVTYGLAGETRVPLLRHTLVIDNPPAAEASPAP